MQIYKCDICGAEIQGERSSVLIADLDGRGNITYSKSVGIDACAGCKEKLAERVILLPLVKKEPVKQDDEKPAEVHEKKKIPFDVGKATSLRRGGWTYAKIADEMRCSPQTVINNLVRAGVIKKKEGTDGEQAGNS